MVTAANLFDIFAETGVEPTNLSSGAVQFVFGLFSVFFFSENASSKSGKFGAKYSHFA